MTFIDTLAIIGAACFPLIVIQQFELRRLERLFTENHENVMAKLLSLKRTLDQQAPSTQSHLIDVEGKDLN